MSYQFFGILWIIFLVKNWVRVTKPLAVLFEIAGKNVIFNYYANTKLRPPLELCKLPPLLFLPPWLIRTGRSSTSFSLIPRNCKTAYGPATEISEPCDKGLETQTRVITSKQAIQISPKSDSKAHSTAAQAFPGSHLSKEKHLSAWVDWMSNAHVTALLVCFRR